MYGEHPLSYSLQAVSHIHSKDIMKAKTHLSQNKSRGGFTLVEMLVVIGMIAALAGISFPVYKSIQKKVEKQKMVMDMQSLKTAVDNFETEYNYLPYITAAYPPNEYTLNSVEIRLFMGLLSGTAGTANFKGIKFFEASEAKGSPGSYHSGLLTNNDGTVVYYTPWGTEIVGLRPDYDKDGSLAFAYGLGYNVTDLKYIYYEKGPNGGWAHVDGVEDDFENHRKANYP